MKKVSNFYNQNHKVINISIVVVVSLLFIGSILLAIFIGGFEDPLVENQEIKGVLKIRSTNYTTSYYAGDTFSFDKSNNEILLLVKDPKSTDLIKEDNLSPEKYGFLKNGEGEIFDEASSITIDEETTSVDIVSKTYTTIKCPIAITVLKGENPNPPVTSPTDPPITPPTDTPTTPPAQPGENVSSLVLEAEDCDLYKADGTKVEIKSSGNYFENSNFSGGGGLKSLGRAQMKMEYKISCSEATTAQLTIVCCKKSGSSVKKFSDYYSTALNTNNLDGLLSENVEAGGGGNFFEIKPLQSITIQLQKGINTLSFTGIIDSPNFDCIKIVSENAYLIK